MQITSLICSYVRLMFVKYSILYCNKEPAGLVELLVQAVLYIVSMQLVYLHNRYFSLKNSQEYNFYKLIVFNSIELKILLQFVTCFSYFLICAIFYPSDCRLASIFMGKWLILYGRAVL